MTPTEAINNFEGITWIKANDTSDQITITAKYKTWHNNSSRLAHHPAY
jgi:hypothetical protein